MANPKDYLKNFIDNDEYQGHTFGKLSPEGSIGKELEDDEEYTIIIKLKHHKENWLRHK